MHAITYIDIKLDNWVVCWSLKYAGCICVSMLLKNCEWNSNILPSETNEYAHVTHTHTHTHFVIQFYCNAIFAYNFRRREGEKIRNNPHIFIFFSYHQNTFIQLCHFFLLLSEIESNEWLCD